MLRLTARNSVDNVEFICTGSESIEGRSFDTAFSLSTVHENCDSSEDAMDQFPELSEKFARSMQRYCDDLRTFVKDDGNIISMERMNVDALFGVIFVPCLVPV